MDILHLLLSQLISGYSVPFGNIIWSAETEVASIWKKVLCTSTIKLIELFSRTMARVLSSSSDTKYICVNYFDFHQKRLQTWGSQSRSRIRPIMKYLWSCSNREHDFTVNWSFASANSRMTSFSLAQYIEDYTSEEHRL